MISHKFLHLAGLLAASVIEPFPGTIKVYVVTSVVGDFTHIGNPRVTMPPVSLTSSGAAWNCSSCDCPNYFTIYSSRCVDYFNMFDLLSDTSTTAT